MALDSEEAYVQGRPTSVLARELSILLMHNRDIVTDGSSVTVVPINVGAR